MKNNKAKNRGKRGYGSLVLVAMIAMLTTFGLVSAYRGSIRAHDNQSDSQTRVDIAQTEDALLRSLVAIVPNKAVATMQESTLAERSNFSWDKIFEEALILAFGDGHTDGEITSSLIGDGIISANRASSFLNYDEERFLPVMGSNSSVNSGTLASENLVGMADYQGRLPNPLSGPATLMSSDGIFPVISWDKKFSAFYDSDALLPVANYPLYNLIPYPNIQFGFAKPGEPFVAKRNWWAFTIDYGKDTKHPLKKSYVLSIYEVPSQSAISASSFMQLGQHADGSDWANFSVDGGVSSGSVDTSSNFRISNGGLAVRNWATIAEGTDLDGRTFDSSFDDMGVREVRRLQLGDKSHLMSLSANSGRVAFIPINPGLKFYEIPDSYEAQKVSSTSWKRYSRGGARCAMQLRIIDVEQELIQRPTSIELTYKTGASATATVTLTRGVNWPEESEAGGAAIPFQTAHLETGREALVLYSGRLENYLASIGGAGPGINHSLVINPDPSRSIRVKVPEFPTSGSDIAIVLKECSDFSAYTKGFALVANLRLYMADDFNQVSVPAPPNSGIPAGEIFYPPAGTFTPEKRYGTTLKIRPVKIQGQVGSLAEGEFSAVHPLDIRAGTYETVTPGLIEVDLKKLTSPAELPPIYVMNWLVTIEELRPK